MPLSSLNSLLVNFLDEFGECNTWCVQSRQIDRLADKKELSKVAIFFTQEQVEIDKCLANFSLVLGTDLAIFWVDIAFNLLHYRLQEQFVLQITTVIFFCWVTFSTNREEFLVEFGQSVVDLRLWLVTNPVLSWLEPWLKLLVLLDIKCHVLVHRWHFVSLSSITIQLMPLFLLLKLPFSQFCLLSLPL